MKPSPLHIKCPECNEVIPVPLVLHVGQPADGNVPVEVEPDMADLWAHAWTHAEDGRVTVIYQPACCESGWVWDYDEDCGWRAWPCQECDEGESA